MPARLMAYSLNRFSLGVPMGRQCWYYVIYGSELTHSGGIGVA